jgi:hypothetical protein
VTTLEQRARHAPCISGSSPDRRKVGAAVADGSPHAPWVNKPGAEHGAPSVNAVAPGPTETGMLNRFSGTPERKAALVSSLPLGRVGAPEEIARAIIFLASNKASFVTGQILAAHGGKTAG